MAKMTARNLIINHASLRIVEGASVGTAAEMNSLIEESAHYCDWYGGWSYYEQLSKAAYQRIVRDVHQQVAFRRRVNTDTAQRQAAYEQAAPKTAISEPAPLPDPATLVRLYKEWGGTSIQRVLADVEAGNFQQRDLREVVALAAWLHARCAKLEHDLYEQLVAIASKGE